MATKRKETKKKKAAPKASRQAAPKQRVTAAPAKSDGTNTIVMTTLAVGAAGVLGYFGWQFYKKKKAQKPGNLDQELLKVNATAVSPVNPIPGISLPSDSATTYVPPVKDTTGAKKTKKKSGSTGKSSTRAANDDFPLKKGSKGENVRAMQQALIGKYGKSILPKYGADGDFGSETVTGLKKAGYPATIDESTFNVILQGGGSSSSNSSSSDNGSSGSIASIAKSLYNAATAKNFTAAISQLKKLKTQDDYQQASKAFGQFRLRGVRQTLVNGMLSSFPASDQKQKIRLEFLRMGLKYDGSKWSLSGFDGKPIVTTEAATVWVSPTESLQVPAMMVLGNEVTRRLDYTMFENRNKYFLVKTQSVRYL